jgi:hypothetical protein
MGEPLFRGEIRHEPLGVTSCLLRTHRVLANQSMALAVAVSVKLLIGH